MIDYSYDNLSRLIEADYNNGSSVLNYGYDVAGNMVNYDGLGNRMQQTISSVVTDYLNDVQPGLTKLLRQDDGTNVEQFVHGVRGIHAVDDGTDWNYYAQDGLGSVRAVVDDAGVIQSSLAYDSYGNVLGGSSPDNFGFTGEQTDANGSVFLRARNYEPNLGMFGALDPLEMMNRYQYVNSNPVRWIDPSGLCGQDSDHECNPTAISQTTSCCGVDVTDWFAEELNIHATGARNYANLMRSWDRRPRHNDTSLMAEGLLLWEFKNYARAIPHKWMSFVTGNSDCPSPSYLTTVSLCGKCVDRSELGNIIFGLAGRVFGFAKEVLWFATYDVAGALRGSAEQSTAGLGYMLGETIDDGFSNIDFNGHNLCEFLENSNSESARYWSGRFTFNGFVPTSAPWQWRYANMGDESANACPCTDTLPTDYPHTIFTTSSSSAGQSEFADILGELNPFYIDQIPGISYLSHRLCEDISQIEGREPNPSEMELCGIFERNRLNIGED